jgi:hypothetical protein
VRGRRTHREPRFYGWETDPQAYEAILAAGRNWCGRAGPDATFSLTKGTLGPIPVERAEDTLDRLLDAVTGITHVNLTAVTADAFRCVAARPWVGAVSLIAGGADIGGQALAELTGLLRDHAELLVYGYIKRGWSLSGALLDAPIDDWPERPDAQPRGIGFTREAFDDLFAPDAFDVQLLGPGYTGRVPASPSWRHQQTGGAVLLEHVDPAAWFDAPFVPFGRMLPRPERHVPEVLDRARTELAPILYTRGALKRAGHVEEETL